MFDGQTISLLIQHRFETCQIGIDNPCNSLSINIVLPDKNLD